MAIRDVFLPLLNYPAPTWAAAIEAFVDLAENRSKPRADAGAHRQIQTRVSALVLKIEGEPGLYSEGVHLGELLKAHAKNRRAVPHMDQAL